MVNQVKIKEYEMKPFAVHDGVPGFLASGLSSGIKKDGTKDLGLLLATRTCSAAGTFTTNRVKAAPVLLARKRLSRGIVQAVLVNSGIANACTGDDGLRDAMLVCNTTACVAGIHENLVIPCSTGVIGVPLPTKRIIKKIPPLVKRARRDGIEDFAHAILTTDTCSKVIALKETIGGDEVKVCGIAKGSGMIMPKMATMLAFIITNFTIQRHILAELLKREVEETFNRISVDGETSTNDSVIALASNMTANAAISTTSWKFKKFAFLLHEVMKSLALLIVRDGEGATKVISIKIVGARDEKDAKKAAFRIANSNLVKTACYGEDFNWGRIMVALGASGAYFKPDGVDILVNGLTGIRRGQKVNNSIGKIKRELRKNAISFEIRLHCGNKTYEVLTCDLSCNYIKINASYT